MLRLWSSTLLIIAGAIVVVGMVEAALQACGLSERDIRPIGQIVYLLIGWGFGRWMR